MTALPIPTSSATTAATASCDSSARTASPPYTSSHRRPSTRSTPTAPTKAARDGVDVDQLTGPLLVTAGGRRLTQTERWRLVRRLARAADVPSWRELSVHSFRHTAITLVLDAGVPLRDVQDFAGHKGPRTTRRYDHSRTSLDRHAAYSVAAYLA